MPLNKWRLNMNKKRITFIVLIAIILTACGSKAPAETVSPTVANTQATVATDMPAPAATAAIDTPLSLGEASATSASGPTVTLTPAPPRPTNAPGCTNSAKFVVDVTIPDNTQIDGGAEFVKTWRRTNSGTGILASPYKISYYSQERMNPPPTPTRSLLYPRQTHDMSL